MTGPARATGDAPLGGVAEPCSPERAVSETALAGSPLAVAGRLMHEQGRWWLVDAFARLPLEAHAGHTWWHGALAIVTGTLEEGTLTQTSTLWLERSARERSLRELERLRADGRAQRLRRRAEIFAAIRAFFAQRGFLEVDTPQRLSECAPESAIDPFDAEGHHLVTSPELHMKRLLVGGIPRLFQLVHCFRKDELGPLHAPEFMLLEWYRAFVDVNAVMRDTEELICELAQRFVGAAEVALPDGRRIDVSVPFTRMTVREAFLRHAGVADAASLASEDEDRFFQLLVDRVEPGLAGEPRPVFLTHFPASQASLARLDPADPSVAERFELYLGGIELCNGYGELTCAGEQRARFEAERARRSARGRQRPGLPERFLAALEQGMPPAAGNAVGVERLVMLLLGQPRIDRVRAFEEA